MCSRREEEERLELDWRRERGEKENEERDSFCSGKIFGKSTKEKVKGN